MTNPRNVSNGFEQSFPSYQVKATDSAGAVHLGDIQHVNIDGLAPSLVTGNLTNYTTPAVEASKVISLLPCKLFVISGFNQNAADRYVHIFNRITLPSLGNVPDFVLYASTGSTFGYTAPILYGRYFSTGLTIGLSTTLATYTAAAADMHLDVQFL